MKHLYFIGFLCGIVLLTAASCKKEEPLMYTKGYIVGFDPCTINHQYRIGYVIISQDLKDTLVTYNLSDIVYKMPASVVFNSDTFYQIPQLFFQNYSDSPFFHDSLRFKYNIKFIYRRAFDNELTYNMCSADIIALDTNIFQVIITSAKKD